MAESRSANILLVDDDVELTVMLSDYLRAEGFVVSAVYNGSYAIKAATSGIYDAVILDVMLPRLSGIEVLRIIRETSDVPIIMLTAKGSNADRVMGLEVGADDYVSKPYFPPELVARLRAVLRRRRDYQKPDRSVFAVGGLHVDIGAHKIRCGERDLELTASEFKLLVTLLSAPDSVVSKDELSQQVLGRPHAAYDRSIDVHISNLRQKLADLKATVIVETVRGVGYRVGISAK